MKLITAAQLFKGFGDQTRLRILNLLHNGEMTGTEIAQTLKVPRGRVARHMRYLYKSWLVTTRRKWRETYYSLRPSDYRLHEAMRRQIIPLLADIDRAADDLRRLAKRAKR